MTKFRKKPLVIDAIQWKGGDHSILEAFCGRNWGRADAILGAWTSEIQDKEEVVVFNTAEKTWLPVPVEHWIIRGIDGEIYPCKPDIFAQTYEALAMNDETSQGLQKGAGESRGLRERLRDLVKAFRKEAKYWKRIDTSIAKTRQDAFNECANLAESALSQTEDGK